MTELKKREFSSYSHECKQSIFRDPFQLCLGSVIPFPVVSASVVAFLGFFVTPFLLKQLWIYHPASVGMSA